jgi:hypothetical protein
MKTIISQVAADFLKELGKDRISNKQIISRLVISADYMKEIKTIFIKWLPDVSSGFERRLNGGFSGFILVWFQDGVRRYGRARGVVSEAWLERGLGVL